MTFEEFEVSTELSKPVEVYTILLGATAFFYTSAEDQVIVNTITYEPIAISRGKFLQSADASSRAQVMEITLPGTNEFAVKYLNIVPSEEPTVKIQRVQRSDFPGPEAITLFEGRVHSVTYKNNGLTATISVKPVAAAASREIPRFTYMNLCNHVLYDERCKVDEFDPTFRFDSGVVTDVTDGITITISGASGFTDDFFNTGFIQVGAEFREVRTHVGDVITVLLPFAEDILGATPLVLAGCTHGIQICKSKFDNVINYGGFAFVPAIDIFKHGID